MNTPNPFLKKLISEIANKTTEGRLVDINWTTLNEAKKKKKSKVREGTDDGADDLDKILGKGKDAAPQKGAEKASKPAPKGDESSPEDSLPDLGMDSKPSDDAGGDENVAAEEPTPEDAEQAQADAAQAKAELEKAKAEKGRAEKEIEQQSYIKISSPAGTQFLLGKILDHAFKTNTIDALAGEMVQKLKIQTPEDMNAFTEDTAAFRVIPGMPELLSSMKSMATKQGAPEEDDDSSETDEQAPSEI